MKEMLVCPVGIGEYLTVLLGRFFYNNALTHCKKKKKKKFLRLRLMEIGSWGFGAIMSG